MAKNIHKGTELNNVKETWDQNERKRSNAGTSSPTTSENLEQEIKEEASEYENVNKEERLLSGDRASVNDDENASGS